MISKILEEQMMESTAVKETKVISLKGTIRQQKAVSRQRKSKMPMIQPSKFKAVYLR